MTYTVSEIHLDHPLIRACDGGSFLLCLDERLRLHRLDTRRHFVLHDSLPMPHPWQQCSAVALSVRGVVALAQSGGTTLSLYSYTQRASDSHSWHTSPPTTCAFNPDGSLLLSGDEEGRVLLYAVDQRHILCSWELEGRIEMLSPSPCGDYLALAHGGTLSLIDLLTFSVLGSWPLPAMAQQILFAGGLTLFVLCEEGSLYRFCVGEEEGSVLAEETMLSEAGVWYQEGSVLLRAFGGVLHAESVPPGSESLMMAECTGVRPRVMLMRDRFLILCGQEGVIRVLDAHKYLPEARMNLEVRNFTKVRTLLESNRMLLLVPEITEALQEGWRTVRADVERYLVEGNVLRAHKIAEPFLFEPSRMEDFVALKNSRESLRDFVALMKRKQYGEALKLCTQHQIIKSTARFEDLSREWQRLFAMAKKILIRGGTKGWVGLEEQLRPFLHLEEYKELLERLKSQPDLFVRVDNAVRHENYKLFFVMTEKHPMLQSLPLYAKLLAFGRSRLLQARRLMEEGELMQAKSLLQQIAPLSPLGEQIEPILQECERVLKMEAVRELGGTSRLFGLFLEDPLSRTLPQAEEARALLRSQRERALETAMTGSLDRVREALGGEALHPYVFSRTAALLRIAYINEMILARKKKLGVHWPRTVRHYADLFGADLFLHRFLERFKAHSLLQTVQGGRTPLMQHQRAFPESILIIETSQEKKP